MSTAISVRLDPALQKRLAEVSGKLGISRSEVVRDALERRLALLMLEDHRARAMPFAEARGYLTDEHVFGEVS